jgi:putative CocE/NonD family hydrolase
MITEPEVGIQMRDGAVLRADVYRPDASSPVPAILSRTPYDRSFGLTPPAAVDPDRAVEAGFALVCQDVRGRYGSDGEFYPFHAEGHDGHDTIEWLAAQPWCSGAIGMAGRSYTAATQWLAAAAQPPHLEAIAPVVIGSNFYNGWVYQGGAFQLGFNLFWAQMMGESKRQRRMSLGDEFRYLPLTDPPMLADSPVGRYYREWLAHCTDDEFWSALSPNRRYGRVEVPALNIGGWYDLFLGGTLENYSRMRREAGSERARDGTRLIVGPWAHGSTYGEFPDNHFEVFGSEQKVDLAGMQLDFFNRHLNGDGADDGPPVRIFVMGENRWRDEHEWPLARAQEQTWFLHGDGTLHRQPPGEEAAVEFVYDPADPAPTIGGPTSLPARFMRTNSGPMDQAPLESRGDVLIYSSAPLERPLEVTGPLAVVLYAATSAPDTDFVAKLCDVSPDGFSRILAEGVLRARYREGFDRPRPIEPGAPYKYRIDLVATSNVFLAGHQLRLLVTSSSFPRFDRNPNSGKPFATDTYDDLTPARQTVFHGAERASRLLLPVVDR